MSQAHKDPPPVAGVHLVKTTSREEDSLASDVMDIMQDALRGGTDCDVGGVEDTYRTTLEQDEARRTEVEFMNALAGRVREMCPWVSGRGGLTVAELGSRDGWRFGVSDREGRPYEVEIFFSEIFEVARIQRAAALSNFTATLDHIVRKLEAARARYFERMQAATAGIQ